MEITLTPELEELISQKVKSGVYDSANEVISESLYRMFLEEEANQPKTTKEKRQRLEELRQEVMKGVEQIRNGEGIVYDSPEELVNDIIKRGTEKLAKKPRTRVSV